MAKLTVDLPIYRALDADGRELKDGWTYEFLSFAYGEVNVGVLTDVEGNEVAAPWKIQRLMPDGKWLTAVSAVK